MVLFRIFLFALLGVSTVTAEDTNTEFFYIKPSPFTGEVFMGMIEDDKALYLLGLGDGINLSPFFKVDEETYARYRSCFQGLTGADLANLVSAYLQVNPGQLTESIHLSAFKAYTEYCNQQGAS